MQPIDFYKLSRPVQERFIGSVNGSGLPAPMLRALAKPRAPLVWLGGTAAAIAGLVLSLRAGFGDLSSAIAIEGAPWLLVDIALIAAAVFGVVQALAIAREYKKSPFRRGVYVFPVGLIDARGPTLRMYPIEDLANVLGPDGTGSLTLDFAGKTFAFAVDAAQAATAKGDLASARGRVQDADAARDSLRPKALAALDPLQGFANPLVSSEPLRPDAPSWAKMGWLIAAGVGIVLGGSMWAVRNTRSDEALFEHAVAAGDVDSLKAYLAKASRHTDKVSLELLPRAELAVAVQAGTVAAVEEYSKGHPQTAIGPEIAAALKAAMAKELAVAVQAGTLAALEDFTKRHPQSHLDAEVKAARHAVYQAALDRYTQQSPPKTTTEDNFVQKLLAWAEVHGPPVEVRFHRLEPKGLDRADAAVQKHKMFRGVVSTPSRYFDAAHDKPREDALAAAVVQRFAQAFPTEILALAVGEPVPDTDTQLPAQTTVPTLFVEHGPVWSGSVIASTNPRGAYVGLGFNFDALFRVPDDTKPLKVKLDVWKAPDPSDAKDSDKPEEILYGKMLDDVFTQFQKRLLGAFFKPPVKG